MCCQLNMLIYLNCWSWKIFLESLLFYYLFYKINVLIISENAHLLEISVLPPNIYCTMLKCQLWICNNPLSSGSKVWIWNILWLTILKFFNLIFRCVKSHNFIEHERILNCQSTQLLCSFINYVLYSWIARSLYYNF